MQRLDCGNVCSFRFLTILFDTQNLYNYYCGICKCQNKFNADQVQSAEKCLKINKIKKIFCVNTRNRRPYVVRETRTWHDGDVMCISWRYVFPKGVLERKQTAARAFETRPCKNILYTLTTGDYRRNTSPKLHVFSSAIAPVINNT